MAERNLASYGFADAQHGYFAGNFALLRRVRLAGAKKHGFTCALCYNCAALEVAALTSRQLRV